MMKLTSVTSTRKSATTAKQSSAKTKYTTQKSLLFIAGLTALILCLDMVLQEIITHWAIRNLVHDYFFFEIGMVALVIIIPGLWLQIGGQYCRSWLPFSPSAVSWCHYR